MNTEHEEPTLRADESSPGLSPEMPQLFGPGKGEVSTQTSSQAGLLKTCEERRSLKKEICVGEGRVQPAGHERKDVLIWELELQKEELL